MPLQHVVKRGDSLWGLAGRHLGNFARWPELVKYHNEKILRSGGNRGKVFTIKDPNVIFVGQILYLPIRDKHLLSTAKATGTKHEAGKPAIPVNLKIQYGFGYDEKPFVYYQESCDFLIKCEMKGKIAIEIFSPDRYKHNLEFIMAKDPMHCKQKLNKIYHPVFCTLTSKPVMESDRGKVIIKSPIAEMANSSAFIVNLNSKKSGQSSGSLQTKPVTGYVDIGGRKFKYYAKIEYSIIVQERRTHSPNSSYTYDGSLFGDKDTGLLNFHAQTELNWKSGTAKSGVNASVAQLQWDGDTDRLSGSACIYHWNTELSGGMTNIYSLGGLEATAKIAAFEGKANGLIKIGSVFIKFSANGSLGSFGVEGKAGLRGVKVGVHVIIGAGAGIEWGFIDELPSK